MAPDGRWGVVLDSMYSWHADCAGIRLTSRVPPPTAGRVRQRQLETGNGRQQEVNTGQAESVRVCGVAC